MEAKDIINYIDNLAARMNEVAPNCNWLTASPKCCDGLDPEVMLEVCEHYKYVELSKGYKCITATLKVEHVTIHLSTAKVDLPEPKLDMMEVLRGLTAKTAA